MGKKQAIKSLANSIALVSVHKIVLRHTNKPESKKHLTHEIRGYAEDVIDKSEVHKWTKEELETIETKALKETKNKLLNKYPDIRADDFEMSEFHQSLIGGLAKLNHLFICGILSMLKNHLDHVSNATSMPPIYDWWFLT